MKKKIIRLKLVRNLYILKWFNLYIIEGNKLNKFDESYKNNLLTLNLFFIFLNFFFTFPLYFISLVFSFKFCGNQTLP